MSGFNVRQFADHIASVGVLKPNRFKFIVPTLPRALIGAGTSPGYLLSGVGTQNIGAAKGITMMCRATSLPGMLFQSAELQPYGYGVAEKKPVMPVFTELRTEIMSDGEGRNWKLVQNWLQLVNHFDLEGGLRGRLGPGGAMFFENNFIDDYAVDVFVNIYDESESSTPKISMSMTRAFPTSISDVPLAWGDTNNLLTFNVSWAFHTWSLGRDVGAPSEYVIQPPEVSTPIVASER
jgi:hypothetical protein